MRATKHGAVDKPAVAVVGVWDPFKGSHRELLENLRNAAAKSGRSSVAVLIDPAPGATSAVMQSYGTNGWPVYDSVAVRVRLIRDLGVDSVLCVRFRIGDFRATAAEFLDTVRMHVPLGELWLGELQMLGPGPPGSRAAIERYADLYGFGLRVLPRAPIDIYDVRFLLASGQVRKAVAQVGRPPTWMRPRSLLLRLAWRPGRYYVNCLELPSSPAEGTPREVSLEIKGRGPACLVWPDSESRYLAFISGPADIPQD
jgi:FAD synthase